MSDVNRAYLYVGEDIPGVLREARDFAKKLNCFASPKTASFCGSCLSCQTFDSGSHPDTFFVQGTKKTIGANDVREQMIAPMAVKPYSHRYKVFIVERAQDLTPQAQNALLKMIEEPAEYGVFLFVAPNTRSFLPTVLSRCDIKKFSNEAKTECSDEIIAITNEIAEKLSKIDLYGAFMLYGSVDKLEKPDIMLLLDSLYVHFGKKASYEACKAIVDTKKILSQNGNTQLAIELLMCRLREANA